MFLVLLWLRRSNLWSLNATLLRQKLLSHGLHPKAALNRPAMTCIWFVKGGYFSAPPLLIPNSIQQLLEEPLFLTLIPTSLRALFICMLFRHPIRQVSVVTPIAKLRRLPTARQKSRLRLPIYRPATPIAGKSI